MIECWECKHSFYSDCYLECGKGYKGVVKYNDTCEHAEPKEREVKKNGKTDKTIRLQRVNTARHR